MSEDGQFPGFCLPIRQRGQTLYHSKNLSSFSYPSDGILVQFKLSLSVSFYYTISSLDSISNRFQQNIMGFVRTEAPTDYRGLADQSQGAACPREVGKFQKHRRVTSALEAPIAARAAVLEGQAEWARKSQTWTKSNLTLTPLGKFPKSTALCIFPRQTSGCNKRNLSPHVSTCYVST